MKTRKLDKGERRAFFCGASKGLIGKRAETD